MFYFWIRRQVRKVMRPIPQKKAYKYATIYTSIYVVTAWFLFGIAATQFIRTRTELKEKDPLKYAENSGFNYGRSRQLSNLHIYSIGTGGLVKEGVYNYDPTEDKKIEETENKEFFGDDTEESLKE